MNSLDIFIKCIKDEADALYRTLKNFGDEINQACELISRCEGKVVVMGVGKTGHIGSKIAATMASTGTPCFFVHATEAVHGDLGMISGRDVVIVLSNSGETEETLRVMPSLKKIGARTISITSNHDSSLARQCDISIAYCYDKEADHLNLAPTVSSTLALAIGDALAVALSVSKGFTRDDFHVYHPGGALGKSLEKKVKS